jgi:hypothetical protein
MFRALALIVAPLAVLAYACGDEEETLPTGAPTTASSDPAPTPTGWLTYTDPGGLFTIDYPADWYQQGSAFYSSNPADFTGAPGLPPGLVKVEVGADDAFRLTACGAVSIDPSTGAGTPEPGATEASMDALPAWEIIRGEGDPTIQGSLTRIHGVSMVHEGTCYRVVAYFTQSNPDEASFELMLDSFKLLPKE